MSLPTITYGTGMMHDCDNDTGFSAVNSANPLTGTSLTIIDGDYFKIGGTADNVADEWVYYKKAITSLPVSSYPKYLLRYKTDAAASFGAKVSVVVGGSEQWLLGTATTPVFNTSWTVLAGTTPGSGNITEIRFYLDDYPDTVAAGTGYAWYDFLLLHKGTWTFPNADVTWYWPTARTVKIPIPGKDGAGMQNLGSDFARVHIAADLNVSGWGPPANPTGPPPGAVLDQIIHEQSSSLWQWLTLPYDSTKQKGFDRKFKVHVVDEGNMPLVDENMSLSLWLEEYKLASTTGYETYIERFGHSV